MNKYVSFLPDEIFLKEVKKVVDAYATPEDLLKTSREVLIESKESIDQFKTLFDLYSNGFDLNEWKDYEIPRQHDKTASNRVGAFHQNILGHVEGWENLKRGHPTKMDLKKEDNSIFIELKNKYNTLNSSSSENTRNKLEKLANEYPNAKIYWAYIVSNKYESFDRVWEYPNHEINENIRNIAGENVYTLVTGDKTAFKQVFNAIPRAINDVKGKDHCLNQDDQRIFDEFINIVFKS